MLSNPLALASAMALCLASTASAQRPVQAVKVLGPVKDAGIYHVATGTWTRNPGSKANLGPDIIYRNDHPSSYFGIGWEGAQGVDEGMLPGPGNPAAGPRVLTRSMDCPSRTAPWALAPVSPGTCSCTTPTCRATTRTSRPTASTRSGS